MKNSRAFMHEWVWTAILLLFVYAAIPKGRAQIAVYPPGVCKEWSAWYDAQPTHPKTLHVKGICTFHAGGYDVKLIRRKPQNIKPSSCILDLAITAPTGIGGIERGIRHIAAHYSEQTEQQCDSVIVEPDHVTVSVKIIR